MKKEKDTRSYYLRRKDKEAAEQRKVQGLPALRNPGVPVPFSTAMEDVYLPSSLETDADITEMSQQLLQITNKCIPLAVSAYETAPKKSNADSLNLFISQSRELANDLRSLQNKKVQTNKIIKECLAPAFQQIHDQMLNIPDMLAQATVEEYEAEIKQFMTLVVKNILEKLKELL